MDDRKIEALLTTVRKGSFSKAAEDLNCTQSAVTQIMNAFESELGFRILERSHSGIRLTKNGEKLLPYIIEADSALSRIKDEARIISSGKASPIRIGSLASIADTHLPILISEYEKLHPDVEYDISIGTKDLVSWFINDEIDIALGDEGNIRAFRWHPLATEKYLAVMTDDMISDSQSEISQEEFSKHTLLLSASTDIASRLETISGKIVPVRGDSDITLVNMVSKGLGVTLLPELSLKSMRYIPDNIVILDLEPAPCRTIGIGMSNNPPKAVIEFAEYIKSRLK